MKLFFILLFLSLTCMANPSGPFIWGPGATAQNLASGGLLLNGVSFINAPSNFLNFDTGSVIAIIATQNVALGKTVRAMKVENLTAIAATGFACTVNPTFTLFDCGLSVNTGCTVGTTAMANVTITAASTQSDGTVTSPNIALGHYWAIQITAGTCTVLNVSGSAEMGMQ